MSVRLGEQIIAGLPLIDDVLPMVNGGTGADNPKNARSNLGAQAQITYGTNEPTGGSNGDVYIQIID